jgi:hypothetical protein
VDSRVVVIEQPNYIPWLGYFDLLSQADIWVWYDDVQYTRRDWRNRNRVAAGDEPSWLTVPVKTRGRYAQRICDVEIDYEQPWVRRHLATVRRCYGRAPHFAVVDGLLRAALEAGHQRLAELTITLNVALCACLGLRPQFLRGSPRGEVGERQERLIAICRRLGATTYLSGPAARAYSEPQAFTDAGLALRYIDYDYPPSERGGFPFVSQLSILDPLAWLGSAATAELLRRHRRWEPAQC